MGDTKKAAEIMASRLRTNDIPSFKGTSFTNDSDGDCATFYCDEENFGSSFKEILGYGDYYGSVSFMYDTYYKILSAMITFGAPKKSVSAMRSDAEFAKDIWGFEVDFTTSDPRHVEVMIKKEGVTLSSLSNDMDNLLVMMSTTIE